MGQGGEFHNNLNLSSEMVSLKRANCIKIAKTGCIRSWSFFLRHILGFIFIWWYLSEFLHDSGKLLVAVIEVCKSRLSKDECYTLMSSLSRIPCARQKCPTSYKISRVLSWGSGKCKTQMQTGVFSDGITALGSSAVQEWNKHIFAQRSLV